MKPEARPRSLWQTCASWQSEAAVPQAQRLTRSRLGNHSARCVSVVDVSRFLALADLGDDPAIALNAGGRGGGFEAPTVAVSNREPNEGAPALLEKTPPVMFAEPSA